jgi:hypothetical protein
MDGRWEGVIEERVAGLDKRLTNIDGPDGQIERLWRSVSALNIEVARIAVKIGIAAAIGSVAGGGIVTLAVYFITRR